MDDNDVGKYFTTDGEDVWQMICYCSQPTATLKNLITGEKVGGSIYSINLKPFKRFIPEGEKEWMTSSQPPMRSALSKN